MYRFKSMIFGEGSRKEEIEDESVSDSSSSDGGVPEVSRVQSVTYDTRVPAFGRKWTEGDELVILKGWYGYKETHDGREPNAETFFDLVKDRVAFRGGSKEKLMDKLKKMKKSYQNHLAEPDKNQSEHKNELYEWCAKIWGAEAVNTRKRKQSDKRGKKVTMEEEECDYVELYPLLMKSLEKSYGHYLARELVRNHGASKAEEMEEEWRCYFAKKAEIELQRNELVTKQSTGLRKLLKKDTV